MLTSWATPREGTFRGAPCTALAWQVGRCGVGAFVLRDEPRIIIVDGEYGDSPARDADVLEVEALAERFNSPELRAAAVRMRTEGKA
jgi:hypothetical protein